MGWVRGPVGSVGKGPSQFLLLSPQAQALGSRLGCALVADLSGQSKFASWFSPEAAL